MNIAKFLRSFAIGFVGIVHAVRSEQNMRIHCFAAVAVIIAGVVFALATWEWIAILLCIGMVAAAECMNTALERLADRVSIETDLLIKQSKDCSSAAVLILALTAAIVGGLIFVPKLWLALAR
jgi:diacylglycerol kinase